MTIWYVDGLNGSDANTGDSPAGAWETLDKLADEMNVGVIGSEDQARVMATTVYERSASWAINASPNGRFILTGANAQGEVDGTCPIVRATGPMDYLVDKQAELYLCLFDFDANSQATSAMYLNSNYALSCFTRNALNDGIVARADLMGCWSTDNGRYGLNRDNAFTAYNCMFANNGNHGVAVTQRHARLFSCIVAHNGGTGLNRPRLGSWVRYCIFDNNEGDGISSDGDGSIRDGVKFCIFTRNNGWGIDSGSSDVRPFGNFFGTGEWANTSGMMSANANTSPAFTRSGNPGWRDPDNLDYTPVEGSDLPVIGPPAFVHYAYKTFVHGPFPMGVYPPEVAKTLSGTVTKDGSPVEGAKVGMRNMVRGMDLGVVQTNASGEYEFTVEDGEEHHAYVQAEDGSDKYNALSKPFIAAP